MANKTKISFNISAFEPVSENSESKLVGGFSVSIAGVMDSLETMSNNCMGGNCTKGCGNWPTNDGCNSVSGCGVINE